MREKAMQCKAIYIADRRKRDGPEMDRGGIKKPVDLVPPRESRCSTSK